MVGSGGSGGEDFELFSQGWVWIEGVPRLPLAHRVDQLDAGENDGCGGGRLKAEYGRSRGLMRPCSIRSLRYWLPQIRIGFAGSDPANDSSRRGRRSPPGWPAAVDDDAIRPSMPAKRLLKKRLTADTPLLPEPELDGIADIDRAVEINPDTADLDVGPHRHAICP
jgi:hypothetical protein